MNPNSGLILAIVTVAGCTTQASEADFNNSIGVKHLTVEESASTLAIAGYTNSGDLIARIDLRTGTFYFNEFEREVEGRQLRVEVRGRVATHESAGQSALRLPLFTGPDGTERNELLLDPRVRTLLSNWQIEINDTRPNPLLVAPPPNGSGMPYRSCAFTPTPDCTGNGAYSCAEADKIYGDEFQGCHFGVEQNVCCASAANGGVAPAASAASIRVCGMGNRNPCGLEGPRGCAVCWSTTWSTSCTVSTVGQTQSLCTDPSSGNLFVAATDLLSFSIH
jgi:hypothetical protein